jgi:PleD family two-component response regulator
MPDFDVLPEELVFAGFSVVLKNGASDQEIVWACKRLSTLHQSLNPRVLTVDDDAVLTNFIATVLSAEDMTVETLNKPILILETLQKFKPDIVLLDVMMPGISGYDICRMLRADEKWKDLSIVFLTSRSDQEGRAAAFQAGGDDFLSKPVLAEELLSRVRAQIEHKRVAQYEKEGSLAGTISGAEFMRESTRLLSAAQAEVLPLSVALLSIDDYADNSINHGMTSAAKSLRLLTELTINHFRTDVLRGRIGEEGIALAFLGENPETVGMALEILLLEYQEHAFESEYAHHPFKCTFSAGVAQFPESGGSIHKLLSEANQRLMVGRREGRGLIRYAPVENSLLR